MISSANRRFKLNMKLLQDIALLMIVLVNGRGSVNIVRSTFYNGVFDANGRRLCAGVSVDSTTQRYFVTNRPAAECARTCLYYSGCVGFNIYDNATCDLITCQSLRRFLAVDSCRASLDVEYGYMQFRENLALGRPTKQSSTYGDSANGALHSGKAVDGNYKDITKAPLSCSETYELTGDPNWWRVQLDRPYRVGTVAVTNRGDMYANRLDYFIVGVTNSSANPVRGAYPLCGQYPSTVASGATVALNCDPNIGAGQYVIIQQPINGTGWFTLCEVEVYARNCSM